MKLFAKINEADLLFKLMHELGSTFYRHVGDEIVEIAYFSSNRAVYFKGKLSKEEVKTLEATAWKVAKIEIDEFEGIVKIEQ